ncbi:MAG TPA: cupin domain-containing protein [Rhodanobacteraceae bacterium]
MRAFNRLQPLAYAAAVLLGVGMAATPQARAAAPGVGASVTPVRVQALLNAPGKDLTAIVVTYPPGGSTPVHHHAGSTFAYVLSGAIRSQVSGQGPAKVYTAGQSFFEPPGSTHLVSANASKTKPAKFLVVFIAHKGAKLTTMGPAPKRP